MHARDDAEDTRVALRVGAHVAQSPAIPDLGDVPAALAGSQLVAQGRELCTELARQRLVGGQQPEDVALRRLLPDAGETETGA